MISVKLYNQLSKILDTMETLVDSAIAQLEALEQEELEEMKAFEAHCFTLGFDTTRYNVGGWSNTTTYFHPHIESMWRGWKAAKGI